MHPSTSPRPRWLCSAAASRNYQLPGLATLDAACFIAFVTFCSVLFPRSCLSLHLSSRPRCSPGLVSSLGPDCNFPAPGPSCPQSFVAFLGRSLRWLRPSRLKVDRSYAQGPPRPKWKAKQQNLRAFVSMIILDENSQVCFHKSMETALLTKITRARPRARSEC